MYDLVHCEIWKDKFVWRDERSTFRRETHLNVVHFITSCEHCFDNYYTSTYNYMYDKTNYIDRLHITLGIYHTENS